MEVIADLENYIRKRQRKGKSPEQIMGDLKNHGYDHFAAQGLVMLHWEDKTDEAKDH